MLDALANQGFALGAERLNSASLAEIEALFGVMPRDRPGIRVSPDEINGLRLRQSIEAVTLARLGKEARIVRALLFDKRDGANWALGWHQDRTIEVAMRIDVPGFGPFTRKQGRLHVAPPIDVIERMLTIRVHLDRVDADNGPLVVAPGSHRLGFIAEGAIGQVVERCGEAACLSEPGDIWFYSTPILHRSDRSTPGRRRRVLQLDIASTMLPGGLLWAADAPSEAAAVLQGREPLRPSDDTDLPFALLTDIREAAKADTRRGP